MPKVVREDIDTLNASLTISISREDYAPTFEQELKKYRDKAHIKGFRKGKTPMSFLKKAYGQSVLSEVINEMLQKELITFMQEDPAAYLGQPIPSEDQPPIDFDVKELEDYTLNLIWDWLRTLK